ncbi:MAG: hypothetical protein LE180_00325 [Endomicrobium sp.]|uniref:hypothetical protein n=1 Tax=Candidatus Endomicrobiellum pyrsonymphae TaxID=1408203 RepID=UPI00357B4669|nr:hypothetical protein [Endomicrobium sp.]
MVGVAVADGEMWIQNVAEKRLRESEHVPDITWAVADAGREALMVARTKTKTKEKLITEVINVEKRLTKTWVDEVRQVVDDVMEKNKNTGKHFGIEWEAERAVNDAMSAKENSSTQFKENNYDDVGESYMYLVLANTSMNDVLDWDMKDRIKENMKV